MEVEERTAAGRAAGALAGVLSAGGAGGVAGHTGRGVETGNRSSWAVDVAEAVIGELASLAEGADVGSAACRASGGALHAGESGLVVSWPAS